jgi:16S rRNA processing protein RimM
MLKSECFELGHITKTTGYKGAVVFLLDVDFPDKYKKLDSVFIEINDKLLPFCIKSISLPSNSRFATVVLENVDNPEKAKSLVNHKLFLPLRLLAPLENDQFYYHEIIGFEVEDLVYGRIGTVTGIIDMTHYPVIQINAGGKEVLVPAVKEMIRQIDRENKILVLSVPDGLIELYTQ